MEIVYLFNSGFLVRAGKTLLVFDDFMDEQEIVRREIEKRTHEALYFFVSHAHFDHFDAHILNYKDDVTKYIFSSEIRRTKRVKAFPEEKIAYMKIYEQWEDERISVDSFSSTDTGTSFLVKAEGREIFHAGDFNWWDWTGETEENRRLARNGFRKQMQKLENLSADLAFFPIDGRMGPSQELGAREFCARTQVRALVAMHNVGFPRWLPSDEFFEEGKEIPVWAPTDTGERRILTKNGEFRETE